MDYGYQLLRHVVQQVFGNLREAAQITLFLFLVPILVQNMFYLQHIRYQNRENLEGILKRLLTLVKFILV